MEGKDKVLSHCLDEVSQVHMNYITSCKNVINLVSSSNYTKIAELGYCPQDYGIPTAQMFCYDEPMGEVTWEEQCGQCANCWEYALTGDYAQEPLDITEDLWYDDVKKVEVEDDTKI